MAQLVKNLVAMQQTWVRSLDWEDPLEKRKATHSSILAWRIPWTVWSRWCQKGASLIAQVVKNLPAVQETWARLLGWEDPLEKEMATHSSILAWRILWTEELGRL